MIRATVRPLGAVLALLVGAASVAPAYQGSLPLAGMNIDDVNYYTTQAPFANMAKLGHQWVGSYGAIGDWYNTTLAITMDAGGYPTSWDANYDLFTQLDLKKPDNSGWVYPAGQYRLSWTGNATGLYVSGGTLVSSGQNYKIYDIPATATQVRIYIPKADMGRTVGDLKLEMPGYHQSTELFNADYVQELARFGLIRYMDWMKVNNSTVDEWADRRLPGHRQWISTGNGVPYEVMVALANATDTDMWVCIPHAANDDYVRQLARLIRFGSDGVTPYTSVQGSPVWAPLEAGRRVWIEYSNETWSTGAPGPDQYNYINNTLKPLYGVSSVAKAYGRRAREIFVLFEQEFGSTDRLVRVVAGQAGAVNVASDAMTEAGDKADAVAFAPYLGGDITTGSSSINQQIIDSGYDTAIYPQLWQSLRTAITSTVVPQVTAHRSVARAYGVKTVTYEGGPGVVNTQAQQNDNSLTSYLTAFHAHSEWGKIVKEHVTAMRSAGLETYVAYEYVRASGKYGYFGHKTYQYQPLGDENTAGSAHKLRELLAWMDNPTAGPAAQPQLAIGESIIVDNVDAGFSSSGFFAGQTWGSGYQGSNWGYQTASGTGSAVARWVPELLGREARYEIWVNRGGGNYTENQPYKVYAGGTVTSVTANLKSAQWVSLGTYDMRDLDRVETRNNFTPLNGLWATVDAVRFTKVADLPGAIQPPTITASVLDAIAVAGETAYFSVGAIGSGTLSYQWSDDGASVGTNATTYTTGTLGLGDNGSVISCAVTNTSGTLAASATSSATLTVGAPVSTIGLAVSQIGSGTGKAYVGSVANTVELIGSGSGFSSAGDGLHYVSTSATGNFRVVVQVASLSGAGRAGLMLREGSGTTARYVEVGFAVGSATASSSARLTSGTATVISGTGTASSTPNRWLMLERSGNTIQTMVSNDDITYTMVDTYAMPDAAKVLQACLYVAGSGETRASFDAPGAINPPEIEALSNDVVSALVGLWKLNETSGTIAADSRPTGAAVSGTLRGNTLWSGSGRLSGCARFDGTGDWVQVPDSADYHGQKMSISAWVNSTTSDATTRGIVSKRTSSSSQVAFSLFTYTGNRLYIDIASTSGSNRVDTGHVLGTGWKHIVMVFDGSLSTNRLKVYINGASTPVYQGNPGSNTTIPDRTSALHIGQMNAGSTSAGWNGFIDDVRIYNRALSTDEVATLGFGLAP